MLYCCFYFWYFSKLLWETLFLKCLRLMYNKAFFKSCAIKYPGQKIACGKEIKYNVSYLCTFTVLGIRFNMSCFTTWFWYTSGCAQLIICSNWQSWLKMCNSHFMSKDTSYWFSGEYISRVMCWMEMWMVATTVIFRPWATWRKT